MENTGANLEKDSSMPRKKNRVEGQIVCSLQRSEPCSADLLSLHRVAGWKGKPKMLRQKWCFQ
jgi:hypothetical protein